MLRLYKIKQRIGGKVLILHGSDFDNIHFKVLVVSVASQVFTRIVPAGYFDNFWARRCIHTLNGFNIWRTLCRKRSEI